MKVSGGTAQNIYVPTYIIGAELADSLHSDNPITENIRLFCIVGEFVGELHVEGLSRSTFNPDELYQLGIRIHTSVAGNQDPDKVYPEPGNKEWS